MKTKFMPVILDGDTFILTKNGQSLHYYGGGEYGWGPNPLGKISVLVEWYLHIRADVDAFISKHPELCDGAQVEILPFAQGRGTK